MLRITASSLRAPFCSRIFPACSRTIATSAGFKHLKTSSLSNTVRVSRRSLSDKKKLKDTSSSSAIDDAKDAAHKLSSSIETVGNIVEKTHSTISAVRDILFILAIGGIAYFGYTIQQRYQATYDEAKQVATEAIEKAKEAKEKAEKKISEVKEKTVTVANSAKEVLKDVDTEKLKSKAKEVVAKVEEKAAHTVINDLEIQPALARKILEAELKAEEALNKAKEVVDTEKLKSKAKEVVAKVEEKAAHTVLNDIEIDPNVAKKILEAELKAEELLNKQKEALKELNVDVEKVKQRAKGILSEVEEKVSHKVINDVQVDVPTAKKVLETMNKLDKVEEEVKVSAKGFFQKFKEVIPPLGKKDEKDSDNEKK